MHYKNIVFLKKIKIYFLKKNILKNKKLYLVGCSAGQDSISLFFVLFILKKQLQIQFKIVHCNHLWQSDNFQMYFEIRQICFFFKINIVGIVPNFFLYNENQARRWRLNVFSKFLYFYNLNKIITAHTASDKVETFFFNIFRGSGISGLISLTEQKQYKTKQYNFSKKNFLLIYKIKKFFFCSRVKIKEVFEQRKIFKNKCFYFNKQNETIFFLRPFLGITRNDTKKFTSIMLLPVFFDKTNLNTNLKRNRIRKQFIPSIEYFYNKQLIFSTLKLITIISDNYIEFYSSIYKIYNSVFFKNKNFFSINLYIFTKLSSNKKRFLFLKFFQTEYDTLIDFNLIEKLIIFINSYLFLNKKIFYSSIFLPKIGFLVIKKNNLYILK